MSSSFVGSKKEEEHTAERGVGIIYTHFNAGEGAIPMFLSIYPNTQYHTNGRSTYPLHT